MFVWAYNSGRFLVNREGKVKNRNKVTIKPRRDINGVKYVVFGHAKYYVHEMVIANHGKPPHKNRLPRQDEVVVFLDGNPENTHIDNLEYRRQDTTTLTYHKPADVPESVEEYVWSLLKKGMSYAQIQQRVAESNYDTRTISLQTISDVRKKYAKRTTDGLEALTPAERQGLDVIKRQLGETDDVEAKRQKLAKQTAEQRAAKAEAERKKAEAEKIKEKASDIVEDALGEFKAVDVGRGWWRIHEGTKDISPKNYREKEAKKIAELLNRGNEEAQVIYKALLDEKKDRES